MAISEPSNKSTYRARGSIRFDNRLVNYDFGELDEVSLAYAVTIHKITGIGIPGSRNSTCHPTLYPAAAELDLYRIHKGQESASISIPK
jgi:hypothetical protein